MLCEIEKMPTKAIAAFYSLKTEIIYIPRIKLEIITVTEGEQDVYKVIAGTSASGCP
jgi:hypothetical protein